VEHGHAFVAMQYVIAAYAADLKFPHRLPQVHLGNFKIESGE
jgi:hypothetical protein